MAGFTKSSLTRCLLAAACMAPPWAIAQGSLEAKIAEIREQSRFLPDKALLQLRQIESAARAAPAATKAEFLAQMGVARMRVGKNDAALLQAEELIAFARQHKDGVALATGLLTKGYVLSAMA